MHIEPALVLFTFSPIINLIFNITLGFILLESCAIFIYFYRGIGTIGV